MRTSAPPRYNTIAVQIWFVALTIKFSFTFRFFPVSVAHVENRKHLFPVIASHCWESITLSHSLSFFLPFYSFSSCLSSSIYIITTTILSNSKYNIIYDSLATYTYIIQYHLFLRIIISFLLKHFLSSCLAFFLQLRCPVFALIWFVYNFYISTKVYLLLFLLSKYTLLAICQHLP